MARKRAVARLRSPAEIRARSEEILALGERGALAHFDVRTDRLAEVARFVARTTRKRYPDLAIPMHSRWRHFDAGGIDRWTRMAAPLSREERCRVAIDLVVPSVLLDAGAGDTWRYRETEGGVAYGRSEGLAVASFHLFASGALSRDPSQPLRADGSALCAIDAARLAPAFQVDDANRLDGLEGRAALLRSLAGVLRARPEVFGEEPRLGGLYDYFRARAEHGRLDAAVVLDTVLDVFAPIWPGRVTIGGVNLGDVWPHRAIVRDDETNGLVPFHKLSQWLAYSLVEPLEDAGLCLEGLDKLTGLAEYRNGGLFVDGGVLEPRDPTIPGIAHLPAAEVVVEWRALSVALLDRLAPLVRRELDVDESVLPLGALLEGGTWAAGRQLAYEAREGGGPPIRLVSDGTVF